MTVSLVFPMILGLVGQTPTTTADDSAALHEAIKMSVETYAFQSRDDESRKVRLQPEPVMRFENPISGVKHGAVYFWSDETGRPEATLQLYRNRTGFWWHEFTSLSTGRFVIRSQGDPDWEPTQPGVEFRSIPKAPRPAGSPERRLRQIRALAEEFAVDDFYQGKSWHPLRLLTKPLARYGKPGSTPSDGALFSFAIGTNPEAFLLIEDRPGPDGPQWQYAFAPMTSYGLKASHKGVEVWNLPRRSGMPVDPFYLHGHGPMP
jgi:hypothetical protein